MAVIATIIFLKGLSFNFLIRTIPINAPVAIAGTNTAIKIRFSIFILSQKNICRGTFDKFTIKKN